MKLKEPIETSEYVQPLCLPPDINTEFYEKECVATGWGKVDYSKDYKIWFQYLNLKLEEISLKMN